MQIVKISEIQIEPERQRKLFNEEKIQELAKSIAAKGLMHPIVVRHNERLELVLVAGERRLKAITQLTEKRKAYYCDGQVILSGEIPVTLLADLSSDEIYEAQLEENVLREDLTWQEKAQAIKQLHELRIRQKGEFSSANPDGQSKADTAEEVTGRRTGVTHAVSKNLLIANELGDEEVAKAKSADEALKIIKKKKEKAFREMLAEDVDLKELKHELMNIDCLEGFELIEYESIDCVVCDPPYGVGIDSAGSQVQLRHEYQDTMEEALLLNKKIIAACYDKLKSDSHMYLFCNIEVWGFLSNFAESIGFSVWPRPLIWDKGSYGIAPDTNRGPKYSYETILYFRKGDRFCNALYNSVLSYNPDIQGRDHAAAKPVDLYVDLLKRSVNTGDIILDPTCGSGTIFEAAEKVGCKAIGMEKDANYYNIAKLRLG